ncbi:hypothetical protein COT72_04245, partial [archaeon CG10_big_fil_rev_8_21_14_0_10_43_11]
YDDGDLQGFSANRTIKIDLNNPVVSLESPADNYNSTSADVDFTFNVTDTLDTSLSCSLYLNGTLWNTTSATNASAFTFSESSLGDGLDQTWNVTCADDSGREASAEQTYHLDTSSPEVTLSAPTSTDYNTASINVTFTAVDNLASTLACWYTLDSTTISIGDVANNTQNITELSVSEGTHTVNVTCNDYNGDHNTTSSDATFRVDVTAPQYSLVSETNQTPQTSDSPDFKALWTENVVGLDSYVFEWNATGSFANESIGTFSGGLDEWFNISAQIPTSAEGLTIDWRVWANDTLDNTNVTEFRTLTVQNEEPVIVLSSPANDSYNTDGSITFSFLATDNGATSLSCALYIDSVLNATNTTTLNNTLTTFSVAGLSEDVHTWNVNCTDSVNNEGASAQRVVTVDLTDPVVSLNKPDDGVYESSSTVEFNFTVTDTLDDALLCNLYLDNVFATTNTSVDNNTLTSFSVSSIADGLDKVWNVTCADNSDRTHSQTRTFNVDTQNPAVQLVAPAN